MIPKIKDTPLGILSFNLSRYFTFDFYFLFLTFSFIFDHFIIFFTFYFILILTLYFIFDFE